MAEENKVEEEVAEEVEENKEAEAEVVEEEKVDQEDQIKILQGEVDKWKNDYYKVFADMENIKRRMQNEHANNLKFMMQGFIEQMLPIVDNFERGFNSISEEEKKKTIAQWLKDNERNLETIDFEKANTQDDILKQQVDKIKGIFKK